MCSRLTLFFVTNNHFPICGSQQRYVNTVLSRNRPILLSVSSVALFCRSAELNGEDIVCRMRLPRFTATNKVNIENYVFFWLFVNVFEKREMGYDWLVKYSQELLTFESDFFKGVSNHAQILFL